MPERKIAIITGASGGIGKNLVFNFENADYKVIALGLVEPTYKLAGVDYMSIDVSDSDNVRDVFAEIHKKYPKTHVLINNAAISNFRKDIFDITDEEFKNVIDVNLCGTFFCSRAFIGHNHTCRFGRIINIASTRFNQNEAG